MIITRLSIFIFPLILLAKKYSLKKFTPILALQGKNVLKNPLRCIRNSRIKFHATLYNTGLTGASYLVAI